MEKRKKYRESVGRTTVPPGNLAEQVQYGKPTTQMWPTPRASAAMAEKSENLKRRVDKKGFLGAKLEESVAMWPTPTARDWKDSGKAVINSDRNLLPQKVAKCDKEKWVKGGGALNPTWVEWLMGYQGGWTDLNHLETVSSPNSPTTSDNQSSRRWPTPTANDGKRGEINKNGRVKETWKKRKDKWATKGVHMHLPLDIAVALDEEEKDGKTD